MSAFIEENAPARLRHALNNALRLLVGLRDSTGVWKERNVIAYSGHILNATAALNQIEADLTRNPTATMANIVRSGGPDTPTEFAALGSSIEAAAVSMRGAIRSAVEGASAEAFRPSYIDVDEGTRKAGQWVPNNDIPETAADTLRASQALADLITALEDAGAIA